MTRRDLSSTDFAGLELAHQQRIAERRFIDARDSDRMELPDAPNASRGNAPMLIAAAIVFLLLTLLVVHLVGLHFKP